MDMLWILGPGHVSGQLAESMWDLYSRTAIRILKMRAKFGKTATSQRLQNCCTILV